MKDIIIGIDAGTSVIKSVAFSLDGEQLAVSSVPNHYQILDNGAAEQDMDETWSSTLKTLIDLVEKIDDLPNRIAAISITGQGDGTWLIDRDGKSCCPAWLWLDSRAGTLAEQFSQSEQDIKRYQITGTGINACQQGAQLLFMKQNQAELLARSETAFHCKDWLYFKLTDQRATDPSEGCFTFGDFRTREYSDEILELLDLDSEKTLLPPIVDGAQQNHGLTASAATLTGLLEGTPVVLAYVDVICTALGAGLYDPVENSGCTIVGSTGMHLGLARSPESVLLNDERTGYTMAMPIPGCYANIQTNMASTLNIDWLIDTIGDVLQVYKAEVSRDDLIENLNGWMSQATPASILYHPYISEAGERGPFIDSNARASFFGLSAKHRFADLVRSVVEGLAYASRDCYLAMGNVPAQVCLTGGAARSEELRSIFGSVLGTVIKTSERKEAGAAGAAMIAAVNVGCYNTMDECVEKWVLPYLTDAESYDEKLHAIYQKTFSNYVDTRKAIAPIWKNLNVRGIA